MESLRVHLFKDSFDPFVALLNAHGIEHQRQAPRVGVPMAAGGVIELLQSAAIWGALATVIVAFIKSSRGRKVVITTRDGAVVDAEGRSPKELEKVLSQAKSLMAIDPNNESNNDDRT